jgi:hypothetical protein
MSKNENFISFELFEEKESMIWLTLVSDVSQFFVARPGPNRGLRYFPVN